MATRERGKGARHLTSRQAGRGIVLALIESHWAWISFICFLAGKHLSHSLDKLQTGRAAGEIFDWPELPELSNIWQMTAGKLVKFRWLYQINCCAPLDTSSVACVACGGCKVHSPMHTSVTAVRVCVFVCVWYSLTLTYAKQLRPENVTTLSLWSNPITEWNWNSLTLARPNSPLQINKSQRKMFKFPFEILAKYECMENCCRKGGKLMPAHSQTAAEWEVRWGLWVARQRVATSATTTPKTTTYKLLTSIKN